MSNIPKKYDLLAKLVTSQQHNLPLLPIPPLQHSMTLLRSSIRGIAHDNQQQQFQYKIQQFLKGIGPILQKRLEQKHQKSEKGWLFDLWIDSHYLHNSRSIIHTNYFVKLKKSTKLKIMHAKSLPQLATNFIQGTAAYFTNIINNQIEHPQIKDKFVCSCQYQYFFNACRLPGLDRDSIKLDNSLLNNYAVVVCRGRFFKVTIFDQNQQILPRNIIHKQIQTIIEQTDGHLWKPSISSLSILERKEWRQSREILCQIPCNKQSLSAIQSCLFLVCLNPDQSYSNNDQESLSLLLGNGGDKFYDKSFQLILTADLNIGFQCDHLLIDGAVMGDLVHGILEKYQQYQEQQYYDTIKIVPEQLKFSIPEQLLPFVSKGLQSINNFKQSFEFTKFVVEGTGRNRIKGLGLSPDSICQIGLQLAYYRIYRVIPVLWQSYGMRNYRYGRIQVIRSTSQYSKQFIKLMDSSMEHKDINKKYELLKKSIKAHHQYIRKVQDGKGMDMHLIALESMLLKNEECPLFDDQLYQNNKSFAVDTTHGISPHVDVIGWGQISDNQITTYYSIEQDNLIFNIGSQRGRGNIYKHEILRAISEIIQIANQHKNSAMI